MNKGGVICAPWIRDSAGTACTNIKRCIEDFGGYTHIESRPQSIFIAILG